MVDYKYDGNNEIPYHYTYYEYDLNGTMTGYAEINASSDPDEGVINNHKLVYNYDVEGNLSEIVYPTSLNDGITSIKFEYNEYNWITKIKAKINSVDKELRDYSYNTDGTINNIKDYTYDTNGNVNGYILKKYTYDNFGRVSSMKYYNSDSDTVKESYTYMYDENSNIKSESIVNNYPTNDSDKVDESREYTYDSMNRLTHSLIEETDKSNPYMVYYTYDKVGNRLSMRDENTKTVTSYTYNDLNQLISSTESKLSNSEDIVSNKNYSYDRNGNNIKEVDSIKNITKEMTYDVDNRLDTYTQTENYKTTTQSNLYNGDGQRIQKSEGDNTINYYYQNGNVLYTTDKDENKTSHNFVGLEGNTISTMRYKLSGFEYYVYNKDIKGSTTNIVDNKNAKISYKYSDFGETEEFGDTDFYNEIAYTGGIYDESTSLYYLNARYYNPEDARFITQDTHRGEVNEPNTLHLYSYCANNPINYVDPTGHKYNANKAIKYAMKYTKYEGDYNPKYNFYKGHDCANFISQCLYAGGIPMTNNWKYCYEWTQGNHCFKRLVITTTWTVVKEQYKYFKDKRYSSGEVILKRNVFYNQKNKHKKESEKKAIKNYHIKIGDIMYFDDGNGKGVRHATMISKISNGRIQYTAHTNNARYKTLKDYSL